MKDQRRKGKKCERVLGSRDKEKRELESNVKTRASFPSHFKYFLTTLSNCDFKATSSVDFLFFR